MTNFTVFLHPTEKKHILTSDESFRRWWAAEAHPDAIGLSSSQAQRLARQLNQSAPTPAPAAAPTEWASMDISSGLGIGGVGSDDYNIWTEADSPSGPNFGISSGQLWQECEKHGCHNEPVCATCFLCEELHCQCQEN